MTPHTMAVHVDVRPMTGWNADEVRQAATALRRLHRPTRPSIGWRLRYGVLPERVRRAPRC